MTSSGKSKMRCNITDFNRNDYTAINEHKHVIPFNIPAAHNTVEVRKHALFTGYCLRLLGY